MYLSLYIMERERDASFVAKEYLRHNRSLAILDSSVIAA
jgi:hypothetical protein